MQCPECHRAAGSGLLCQECGGLLPPHAVDKFAALGVPRRFHLDAATLETRHRELSKKLHPDRFARADARTRMLSAQATTTLNDAYRTLKRPVARAEYLLELCGLRLADNEPVAPEFLGEIMEQREQLEEAKFATDAPRLARLGEQMEARRKTTLAAIDAAFTAWEAAGPDDPAAAALLAAIKGHLVALRYFQRFLDAHAGEDQD